MARAAARDVDYPDVARSEKSMVDLKAGRGYYRPTRSGHASEPGGDRQRRRIPAHPASKRGSARAAQRSGEYRGRGGYARIIGAEYIATLLLIFGLLITGTKKETRAQTLARFTAASLVFALLALLSTGPRSGRVAAAFGGLILIVAALDAATELETIANALDPTPDIGGGGFLNPPNTSTGPSGTATQRIQAV